MTWLLILHLHAGGIQVITLPDMMSCFVRSEFELRHNQQARSAQCVPYLGGVA